MIKLTDNIAITTITTAILKYREVRIISPFITLCLKSNLISRSKQSFDYLRYKIQVKLTELLLC